MTHYFAVVKETSNLLATPSMVTNCLSASASCRGSGTGMRGRANINKAQISILAPTTLVKLTSETRSLSWQGAIGKHPLSFLNSQLPAPTFRRRRTVDTESLRPSPSTALFECNLLSGIWVSPLQIGLDLNSIFYVVSLLVFVAYGLYAPRIQVWFALNEIGRGLTRLKVMKDRARKETIDYLTTTGKASGDPTERVDQFLDYITIMPVDID